MTTLRKTFSSLLLCAALIAPVRILHAQDESGRDSTPAAQSPATNQKEADTDEEYKHSAAVAAFGKVLGLNTTQAATVFEVGNFVVLAGLIGFFLVKTLPRTFRDRTSAIQKHLVDARVATEEASARLNSVEARLAKLDGEIAAMKAQAEKDAATEEHGIKASVEDERKKILAAAEQEIAAATTQARRQLQIFAAELAIDQAARKLVVSAETDRLIVQGFAKRLTADVTKGGHN